MRKKHLFLALDAKAWGRVTLALNIARELEARNDEVVFIANDAIASIIRRTSFRVEPLGDHLGALSALCIEELIESEAPDSMILCDLHSCSRFLALRDVDPQMLVQQRVPVIAMDIWNCKETDDHMDVVGDALVPRAADIPGLSGRIAPVPIARISVPGAYCGLAPFSSISPMGRALVRRRLGLSDEARVVMFCTAGWQHEMRNTHGARLAATVPRLLWQYLADLDRRVHLLHVGPAPLDVDFAEERYRWSPPVGPGEFDEFLSSAELFLSANVASSTIGRAIAARTPIVVVHNSVRADSVSELTVSPQVSRWLATALPIYPFSMWPLGYHKFLAPLLQDNSYCSTFTKAELLDDVGFADTCNRLLFNLAARDEATLQQERYSRDVGALPRAPQVIDAALGF